MSKSKKPQKFNIVHHLGQVNEARTIKGRVVKREEFLFVKFQDQITFVRAVYDPDHFLYQNTMPVSEEDVQLKYLGQLPAELMGANVMCTCGAEGVIMLEGPYVNMCLCRSVAQFGKHQTSFKVEDNKLVLDKRTSDEKLMTDAEIKKTLKTEEQEQDEANSQ